MRIAVLNLDKCLKKFEEIKHINLGQPIMESTRIIQGVAKEIVQVDTGNLQGSIEASPIVEGDWQWGGRVHTPVEYAPYLEWGTTRNRAYPFLWPAYEQNKEGTIKRIQQYAKMKMNKLKKA